MNSFCKDFILFMNDKLCEFDLEVLDKISKTYNVLELKNIILEAPIELILSYIIVNVIPYNVATRLVMANGKLVAPIVTINEDRQLRMIGSNYGQYFIENEVKKLNKLINGR